VSAKPWSRMTSDERLREWLHERRNFENGVNRFDPGTFDEYTATRSAEDAQQAHVDDVHARLRAYVGKNVELVLHDGSTLRGRLASEGARTLQLHSPGAPRPHDVNALRVEDVRLV